MINYWYEKSFILHSWTETLNELLSSVSDEKQNFQLFFPNIMLTLSPPPTHSDHPSSSSTVHLFFLLLWQAHQHTSPVSFILLQLVSSTLGEGKEVRTNIYCSYFCRDPGLCVTTGAHNTECIRPCILWYQSHLIRAQWEITKIILIWKVPAAHGFMVSITQACLLL